MAEDDERHSKAVEAELITDPEELAKREARNALRQFDAVVEMIDYFLQPEHPFKLRPSKIQHLHRAALEGITVFAGNWRPAGIEIAGSKHQPVGAQLVAEEVEHMCDYVNDHWDKPAIHLAAYTLWRLNWIHPFTDGNGRTARAVSYVVLCVRLSEHLPGRNTIPEQIALNKKPYYEALEAADKPFKKKGTIDVSAMETLLEDLLARQLASVLRAAAGSDKDKGASERTFH